MKIKVGLIGFGRMGRFYLKEMQKSGRWDVAYICDINPDCRLTIRAEKYEAGRREDFFDQPLDYIVDCIDLVSCKLDLIETALTRGVPIVSSLGTGNKLDPGLFRITDLSKTEGCPLARVVRKELRARGILHHRVLW